MKNFIVPVALAAALSAGAVSLAGAAPERHNITHGTLGRGTVTLWQQGSDLGVTIDKAALASLPAKETRVDLPVSVAPFHLVEVDWHPHGHPPAHVYTVPHFDVHFYVITKSERDAIAFAKPGTVAKPADSIVPMGYITDGTVEPQMGMHYVSRTQPEFYGQPFTAAEVWGYNKGHLAFIEPMFSLKFVNEHTDWSQGIFRPKDAKVAADLPADMGIICKASSGCDIVLSD